MSDREALPREPPRRTADDVPWLAILGMFCASIVAMAIDVVGTEVLKNCEAGEAHFPVWWDFVDFAGNLLFIFTLPSAVVAAVVRITSGLVPGWITVVGAAVAFVVFFLVALVFAARDAPFGVCA